MSVEQLFYVRVVFPDYIACVIFERERIEMK